MPISCASRKVVYDLKLTNKVVWFLAIYEIGELKLSAIRQMLESMRTIPDDATVEDILQHAKVPYKAPADHILNKLMFAYPFLKEPGTEEKPGPFKLPGKSDLELILHDVESFYSIFYLNKASETRNNGRHVYESTYYPSEVGKSYARHFKELIQSRNKKAESAEKKKTESAATTIAQ